MDENVLKRLLAEGESARLDFKSQQYLFAGASDGQKGELLKDILAMANASREVDAFILIGIKEQAGMRPAIVGIVDHLDDADLQQFVNTKTNRPIRFSYAEFQYDDKTIGIIQIPLQRRPFFVKRQFGPVQAGSVYMRRGSSTVVADPDEVHDMGASSVARRKPTLMFEFARAKERRKLGSDLKIHPLVLKPLGDADLPRISRPVKTALPRLPAWEEPGLNYNYWTEVREYVLMRNLVCDVGFAVTNGSAIVADDVRAVLTLPTAKQLFVFQDLPPRPRERTDLVRMPDYSSMLPNRRDIDVEKRGSEWHIEIRFGKVQPGATNWADDDLWIGAFDTSELVLKGQMFGDNFEPVPVELKIVSEPDSRAMTLEDLQQHKAESNRNRRKKGPEHDPELSPF